jgi:hypothetical protein
MKFVFTNALREPALLLRKPVSAAGFVIPCDPKPTECLASRQGRTEHDSRAKGGFAFRKAALLVGHDAEPVTRLSG